MCHNNFKGASFLSTKPKKGQALPVLFWAPVAAFFAAGKKDGSAAAG